MGFITPTQSDAGYDRAKRELEKAKAAVDRAAEKLEQSRHQLAEPTTDVITFSKKFDAWGSHYEYAAIRVGSFWYVTGATSPNRITWAKLVEFIRKDNLAQIGYNELHPELPF